MTDLTQGPPVPGAPVSQEMRELMPFIAQMIQQEAAGSPDYQFGSIGKGLLGGLFNLVGGVFGNEDLGGELFGQRTDNPEHFASVLLQYAGLEQESKERQADREFQRSLIKLTQGAKKEEIAARHEHERAMMRDSADIAAEQQARAWEHDKDMATLGAKQRKDLALWQHMADMEKTGFLTEAETRRAFDAAKMLYKHQGNQAAMDRLLRFNIAKLDDNGRRYVAQLEAESREAAARAEAASRQASAEAAANEKRQEREEKKQEKVVGSVAAVRDVAEEALQVAQQNSLSDLTLNPNSAIDIVKHLGQPYLVTDAPIPREVEDTWYSGIKELVGDYYTANPDGSPDEAREYAIASIKKAVADGRTALDAVNRTRISDTNMSGQEGLGREDTALKQRNFDKFQGALLGQVDFAVNELAEKHAIERNVRQAAQLVGQFMDKSPSSAGAASSYWGIGGSVPANTDIFLKKFRAIPRPDLVSGSLKDFIKYAEQSAGAWDESGLPKNVFVEALNKDLFKQ